MKFGREKVDREYAAIKTESRATDVQVERAKRIFYKVLKKHAKCYDAWWRPGKSPQTRPNKDGLCAPCRDRYEFWWKLEIS